MRILARLIVNLAKDQRGGEAMEYAIIVGLIIATAAAVIGAIGTKVFGRWTPTSGSR
jgi:pilus assembly protein Flp/PilA